MVCSGAAKKKQDANDNCEQGNYYLELVEKNKKLIESGKSITSFYEIEKAINFVFLNSHTRILQGHSLVML